VNRVRIFQHVLVGAGGTDGADDALADAGDDRVFRRAANEPFKIGANRDAGLDQQPDAVFRNRIKHGCALRGIGAVNDFRIHARAHRVVDIAAGKINCGSALERELDIRLVGGDQCLHDIDYVTAGEEVCLQRVGVQFQAGLDEADARIHDQGRIHASQLHADEVEQADARAGHPCADPDLQKIEEKSEDDKDGNGYDDKQECT